MDHQTSCREYNAATPKINPLWYPRSIFIQIMVLVLIGAVQCAYGVLDMQTSYTQAFALGTSLSALDNKDLWRPSDLVLCECLEHVVRLAAVVVVVHVFYAGEAGRRDEVEALITVIGDGLLRIDGEDV